MRYFCLSVVLAMSLAQSVHAALISHWAMNENTGTSVADSVSAHNGAFAGATSPQWVTGHPGEGSGLSFPNTPDSHARVEVTNHADFSPSSTLTLIAWAHMTTVSGGAIITKLDGTSGVAQWQMTWRSDKTMRCSVRSGGATVHKTTVGTIADNTWTFVACAWGNDLLHAYLNATEDGSGAATTGTMVDNTYNVTLGNTGFSGGRAPFIGTIDEVRLYNTELTQGEIAALMAGTTPPRRRFWLSHLPPWLRAFAPAAWRVSPRQRGPGLPRPGAVGLS